ncbi:MAG: MOFRL family protein, partial [Rhodosalinus sp.]
RNQALALMVARGIAGQEGAAALIAGTDGTDGPTGAAGAFVDGASWGPGAGAALAAADSGTWLAANGLLFEPGPTGTNVMDLALGLKAG